MNKVIFIFALLLTVVAFNTASATEEDPQFKRIIADTVMLASVNATAEKFGLTCKLPTKIKALKLLCDGAGSCTYNFLVPCYTAPQMPTEQPVKKLDIFIFGKDNGVESLLQTVEIYYLR
ncbi:MAG: hypothetical protein SGI74_01005 [Oligoflexia bacterium]|nr:hypothetical protein [Oligoflexia bacterium]